MAIVERKSFTKDEVSSGVDLTLEEIQALIEENKKLKESKTYKVKDGDVLWGYEIYLSPVNGRYRNQKSIDFGENGKIYTVVFGKNTEVPISVVENIKNHIKYVTEYRDNGTINNSQVHYDLTIIREIYKAK